jgi:CBS domain-containing protein
MNTIRDILDTKGSSVYTILPDASIQDAVIEMCRVKVGALLVRGTGRAPLGILSERDLMVRVLLKRQDPLTTRVSEVMTTKIISVEPDCLVSRAMVTMTRARCRHLPVIEDDFVVGLVSIGDLVRHVSHSQAEELRLIHEYVEGRYPG